MSDAESGLSRRDVRLAYLLMLGREPESVDVVDAHRARHADLASLSGAFMASDEFRQKAGVARTWTPIDVERGYWATPTHVDHRVPAPVLDRLAARIKDQWTALGEQDPYWSVLTDDRFRSAQIDAAGLAAFHASGAAAASLIDITVGRSDRPKPSGTCLELGCGVGRVTRHLAKRFDRVIAVDISPGNLALCRRYMEDEGVANVETVLVQGVHDFASLPTFDFFYSVIVLQHNSPPVQRFILESLLSKLRPAGQFLFQAVADRPGYAFDVDRYLASAPPEMEVHSLPMPAIMEVIRSSGLVADSVRLDPWAGFYGSYTFHGAREA
ncbi:class I SAM-dependent methyltransferase [Sphingomonas radiodurans]|uniref:class I SAM-dependent methyltransferase n=1 Tax=Sphingomonas radiodurans TaxID=2890321 RepID=UPI001E39B18B|nr:class I SAM-dependent methyltransferase [Sphingomonas radiodurans]WBH15170.1 class I SAM-dependent methyltransferase [Sphingomonas radiodurans]